MDDVNWFDGQAYTIGWWVYIFLLWPTFFLNVGVFTLITCSPRLSSSSNALLVRYLAVQDAAFALFCLVQCSLNLDHGSLYGGQPACSLQASYLTLFALSTGYTLCCIAYNSEQKIAFKPGLSQRQVLYLHLAFWSLSATVALVCSVALAPARLVPSGTYCLPALDEVGPLLLVLSLGTSVILGFTNHRYYLMYTHIRSHSAHVLSTWEQHRLAAQQRQVAIAKRMVLLMAIYALCYLPELSTAVWEAASGQQAPAAVHLTTGVLVHLNSFLNPLLYALLNKSIRVVLWDTFTGGSRNRVAPLSVLSSTSPRPPATQQITSAVSSQVELSKQGGATVLSPHLTPARPHNTRMSWDRPPLSPVRPSYTRMSTLEDRPLPPLRAFELQKALVVAAALPPSAVVVVVSSAVEPAEVAVEHLPQFGRATTRLPPLGSSASGRFSVAVDPLAVQP